MQGMQVLVGIVFSPHAPGRQARAVLLHAWLQSTLFGMTCARVIPSLGKRR